MPQYAVVLIHEDSGGQSWGPFRSFAQASKVFDVVMEVFGLSDSDVRVERLQPWPGRKAWRESEYIAEYIE